SGVDAKSAGSLAIGAIGIGDVQSLVEIALRNLPVDGVIAFWRLLVAFALLGSDGRSAERDFVDPQHAITAPKGHGALRLNNSDAIHKVGNALGCAQRLAHCERK